MSDNQDMRGNPEISVFISYASEDKKIANLIYNNLKDFAGTYKGEINVELDYESFSLGTRITEQILTKLVPVNFLFVIYTGRARPSVSYPGLEVGSFLTLMMQEREDGLAITRRLICLYVDTPPQPLADSLGINLDIDALSGGGGEDIDPNDGLFNFFDEVGKRSIEHLYRQKVSGAANPSRVAELKGELQREKDRAELHLRNERIPALKIDIAKILSSLKKDENIEQVFLQIKWPPVDRSADTNLDSIRIDSVEIMSRSLLYSPKSEAFRIFGINMDREEITWERFCREIEEKSQPKSNGVFIRNSIVQAVKSGVKSGPVDNDLFLLAPSGTRYRIIITRHYEFLDGGKIMHVYLIPFLSQLKDDVIGPIVELANVSSLFRMLFINSSNSKTTVSYFASVVYSNELFQNSINLFIRDTGLIDGLSHVFKLDDPGVILRFFPNISDNVRGQLFKEWLERKLVILELANEISSLNLVGDDVKLFDNYKKRWIKEYGDYVRYTSVVNEYFGRSALSRLSSWFKGVNPPLDDIDYKDILGRVPVLNELIQEKDEEKVAEKKK